MAMAKHLCLLSHLREWVRRIGRLEDSLADPPGRRRYQGLTPLGGTQCIVPRSHQGRCGLAMMPKITREHLPDLPIISHPFLWDV